MRCSWNGGSPKPWVWVLKWSDLDDLGVPAFWETSICQHTVHWCFNHPPGVASPVGITPRMPSHLLKVPVRGDRRHPFHTWRSQILHDALHAILDPTMINCAWTSNIWDYWEINKDDTITIAHVISLYSFMIQLCSAKKQERNNSTGINDDFASKEVYSLINILNIFVRLCCCLSLYLNIRLYVNIY